MVGHFLCSSLSSFSNISMNFWVPTFLRYARSPALVKTLFCPCAGSNWFTNKSHRKSSQIPQCSTLPVAQACSLHSPQKGCPFWLPHPEQLGFSFLFKKAQVPQYVPHGATSFSSIHSASGISRLALLLLVWFGVKFYPAKLGGCVWGRRNFIEKRLLATSFIMNWKSAVMRFFVCF